MAATYMRIEEVVDYAERNRPVICAGSVGCWGGEFKHPWGVAVDYTTDYIYVADCKNNRVQVLNGNGEFLFDFGHGLMNNPIFITIDKDTVFVSQISCLTVYNLDGNFIKQIGSRGSGERQLVHPRGLLLIRQMVIFMFVITLTIVYRYSEMKESGSRLYQSNAQWTLESPVIRYLYIPIRNLFYMPLVIISLLLLFQRMLVSIYFVRMDSV